MNKIIDGRSAYERFQEVKNRIVSVVNRSFDFKFVDSPEIIFHEAGGQISVSSGAVRLTANDHELAFCIAHEISHTLRKHGEKTQAEFQEKWRQLTEAYYEEKKHLFTNTLLLAVGAGLLVLNKKARCRKQETEADLEAVLIMKQAGYDPSEVIWFVQTMGADSFIESLFRDHPDGRTRAANILAKIRDDK